MTALRSNAPGRAVQTTVNEIARRLQNKAEATLVTGSATTIVRDPRFFEDSLVVLVPLTETAAAELASGGCFVSSYATGSITIQHAANPDGSRRFGLVIH